MPLAFTIRAALVGDLPFLQCMLREAAYWRPDVPKPAKSEMLVDAGIIRYLSGWGRVGDAGYIAVDEQHRPIGAAWYRVFSKECPGYGFIDESMPEVAVAVKDAYRGNGVGTALLMALIQEATVAGFPGLSLSVGAENRALRLYERLGFVGTALVQGSWTMECRLRD